MVGKILHALRFDYRGISHFQIKSWKIDNVKKGWGLRTKQITPNLTQPHLHFNFTKGATFFKEELSGSNLVILRGGVTKKKQENLGKIPN